MSDSARIIQTTALEVPVTIQGSQIVEGTEQREMFTETTRTTLVFENGAAIVLKARVQAGQSVFLRNELTGKEVLCKIVEVPPAGQPGPTEVEFTVREPGFWDPPIEQSAAPALESAAAQAAVESAPAGSGTEASAPTASPATAPDTSAAAPSSPTQEQAAASPAAASAAEPDHSKEAEQLAAMVAKDAKEQAKRASTARPSKEISTPTEPGQSAAAASTPAKALSPLALRLYGIREDMLRENRSVLAVAAFVLVAVALGVAWHTERSLSKHRAARPSPTVPHASAGPAVTPPQSAQPATAAPQASTQAAKSSPPTPTGAEAARVSHDGDSASVSNTGGSAPSRTTLRSSPAGAPTKSVNKTEEPVAKHIVPAKILSQTQPPLPSWAKALDVNDVVTLDAVIDERGNVASATLLSGPRLLERAAKDAVQLWVFEPTLANGKPIPTHMVLTVEFQQ